MTKTVGRCIKRSFEHNRPFHDFFNSSSDWDQFAKIRQHDWNEHPKINKVAKLESNLLKTYEDIAL